MAASTLWQHCLLAARRCASVIRRPTRAQVKDKIINSVWLCQSCSCSSLSLPCKLRLKQPVTTKIKGSGSSKRLIWKWNGSEISGRTAEWVSKRVAQKSSRTLNGTRSKPDCTSVKKKYIYNYSDGRESKLDHMLLTHSKKAGLTFLCLYRHLTVGVPRDDRSWMTWWKTFWNNHFAEQKRVKNKFVRKLEKKLGQGGPKPEPPPPPRPPPTSTEGFSSV